MAKKVILKDDNIEIMPITRGELVLDSSGQLAFHSSQFLATQSLPGLMSGEDKTKLDSLEKVTVEDKKVEQVNTTTNSSYRILFSNSADDTTKTEGARKSAKLLFNPSTGALTATALIGKLDWSNLNNIPEEFTPTQHIHNTSEITALTSYSKASSASDLVTTDTLNAALGKLEYKADTAYDWIVSVTTADTDKYINKWQEIIDFLNAVDNKEGADIIDEFVTRKTDQTITGVKTFALCITIQSGLDTKLVLNNTDTESKYQFISFRQNGTQYGYLGTLGDDVLKWSNNTILHSGNSYIQNGVITINGATITPITSHQSLANYVTLNGKQDITGEKTFKATIKAYDINPVTNSTYSLGTSSLAWKNVYATNGNFSSTVNASGFVKKDSSDSYVLLGGGGHKALSDFVLADGTNATGTWSINISGNAKSSTLSLYLLTGVGSECDANTLAFSDHLLRWYSSIPSTSSNLPTVTGWLNGLLALPLHSNGVTAQLYFSATKALFYRSMASDDWHQIAYKTDIPTKTSQLTNDSGYVTGGPYLPLSGGRMNSTAYIRWNDGHEGNDFSDWNSVAGETGLKIISSVVSTSNAPSVYSTALHVKGRYGFQLASIGGSGSKFYIRNIRDISDWCQLIHSRNINSFAWTSSNDGSDSGLDADLLDGLHGSWYLNNVIAFNRFNYTGTNLHDANVGTSGMLYNYGSNTYWRNTPDMSYGQILTLRSGNTLELAGQLAWDINHNSTTDTTRYLWWRATDDGTWTEAKWHRIAYADDIPTVTNYYWANVPVSSSSSTTTTPTFGGVTVNGGRNAIAIKHTHTLSTAWNDFITCLNPNLTATYHTAHITFGRTYDSKNVGYIGFKYAGSASNSNMVTIGLHSVDNILNILASGNVGIGTTSPSERLHVNGTGRVDNIHLKSTYINLNRNGSNSAIYDSTKTALEIEATTDLSILRTYNVTTQASIVLHKNGCIGIGTLTPTERLLVNGNIKIQGTGNTSRTPDIYLGYYTSWNGNSYPTLMSGHAGKWVMHLNPHIARHTGTDTPGANLRMESINKHYFDVSVGHDGLDTFKVRYDNSKNVLTISNTGQVNLINSIVFTGSVGSGSGTYLAGTGTDGLFLAANESGKKVFLESTNQDSPWFRNKNGDYAILHTGNASVFHRSDFNFTDGTTVADWTKATSATRYAGNWFSVTGWAWANSGNINVGGNLLDRMRYSALSIRNGNLTSTWAQQAILFIPTYADSGVIYLAQMTTSATAGSVSTTIKYYGDVGYNDGRYVNVTGDTMTGNLTAPAFYASSDVNLKTNIQEIFNSDKMPIIKEFDWKEDNSHSYGLIALELEEMGYPELVNNSGSHKTVNYSAALSLIVGKLQVKIKELEKEIEILKKKN